MLTINKPVSRYYALLVLTLLFSTLTFARDETVWTKQNSGTTKSLNSIYLADANTFYAVGYDGTIIKSSDGGASWISQKSNTLERLNSVFFINANTGFAVGENGTIIKTTNGGSLWIIMNSGTAQSLNSVFMVDSETGYAVGNTGTILKTSDGGINWDKQISNYDYGFSSVYFTDKNTGFVVGGRVMKTIDGGNTWIANYNEHSYNNLYSVEFINSKVGIVVGERGEIGKTTDGGDSWTYSDGGDDRFLPPPFLTKNTLYSVYFINETTGFAVGQDGMILKTTDSGMKWSILTAGSSSVWFNTAFFVNQNIGYVAGACYGPKSVFLKTTDGGKSWVIQNWNIFYLSAISSVFFTDAETGYAVSGNRTYQGCILKTTDGGNEWKVIYVDYKSDYLNKVYFFNQDIGYAIGTHGSILKTIDGGVTWKDMNTEPATGVSFQDVYFVNPDIGYAVGEDEIIFKTINGGETWFRQNAVDRGGEISSVYFKDENVGFAAGSGFLYTTVDGGLNWNRQSSSTGISTYFIDANTWYSTYSNGYITKTNDGGKKWEYLTTGTKEYLKSIIFVDGTGYAVGNNSTIIKTTGTSVGFSAHREILTETKIYPNPTENMLIIEFPEAFTDEKHILIYNVNGQKIMDKYIEDQNVEIDISSLQPGIYLLKIFNDNSYEQHKFIKN